MYLGENIGDLWEVGFVVPAEGGQVLDGLLPDVHHGVLAQVQHRVNRRVRDIREMREKSGKKVRKITQNL